MSSPTFDFYTTARYFVVRPTQLQHKERKGFLQLVIDRQTRVAGNRSNFNPLQGQADQSYVHVPVFALLGQVKVEDSLHYVLVTRAEAVATIGSRSILRIEDVEFVSLTPTAAASEGALSSLKKVSATGSCSRQAVTSRWPLT